MDRPALGGFVIKAGVEVLRAGIDVTLGCPYRQGGDGGSLDQVIGVALHQHPVREGAGVALVRIADDTLGRERDIANRGPLDPGREGSTAVPAQARVSDLLHDPRGLKSDRPPEPGETAMRVW